MSDVKFSTPIMNASAVQVTTTAAEPPVSTESPETWWVRKFPDDLQAKSSLAVVRSNDQIETEPSLGSTSSPFYSIFHQVQNIHNLSLISMIAIISICVFGLIGIVILTYRRHQHLEDEKQRDEFKKRKWVKRQSSRYSIDLDRFVADIVGPDGELQVNQKAQELKIPTKPKPQSNQTLNPLAVSIIDLLARNYHCEQHLPEHHHNHNEPLPGSAVPSFTIPAPDPKLNAVNEDDEDVLFENQSINSYSRQCSEASNSTLETIASVSVSMNYEQHNEPHRCTDDGTNCLADHNSRNNNAAAPETDKSPSSSDFTSISIQNIDRTNL